MGVGLRQRLLWAGAFWAERRRDYAKALRRLERLATLRELTDGQRAFKAMLLLSTGDTVAAHALFAELRQALKGKGDARSRYIRRYAQYWLAVLTIEPAQADHENREAKKIDCPPALKRLLWLPPEPQPDQFDAEFERWMKANHPDA